MNGEYYKNILINYERHSLMSNDRYSYKTERKIKSGIGGDVFCQK